MICVYVFRAIFRDYSGSVCKQLVLVYLYFILLLPYFLFQIKQARRRGDFNQPLVDIYNRHDIFHERYIHVILHDVDFEAMRERRKEQ